jgi:hypothetical protein
MWLVSSCYSDGWVGMTLRSGLGRVRSWMAANSSALKLQCPECESRCVARMPGDVLENGSLAESVSPGSRDPDLCFLAWHRPAFECAKHTATINASHLSHSNDTDNDTGEHDQSLQCSQTITAIWHCLLLFSAKTCATAGGNCSWRPCVDHTILGELSASCATFPFPKARVGRSQMFFAPHHTPRLLSMQPRWETLQLCRVLLLHASLLSTFAVRAVRPIGREAGEAALQLATRYRFARVNPGVGHGAVT